MKKYGFLIVISTINAFIASTAQDVSVAAVSTSELTYTQASDSFLYPTSKAQITTGVLYDRVFPFASLHSFNRSRPDTSDYDHFIQAYTELYGAAYSKTNWKSPGYIDTFIKALAYTHKVIPIGVLYYDFNLIWLFEKGRLQTGLA